MEKKFSFPALLLLVYSLWFVTPVLRYLFDGIFTYMFMGIFIFSLFLKMLLSKRIYFDSVAIPVVIFCVLFVFMAAFGAGNATGSVRVLVSYWLPLFAFLQFYGDEEYSVKIITKVIIFFIMITVVTTFINLLTNPNISRILASSGGGDLELAGKYKIKNCGSLNFIQGMVLAVPALVINIKKKMMLKTSVVMLVFISVLLLNASFTIALITFVVAIVISFVLTSKMHWVFKAFWLICCALLLMVNVDDLLVVVHDIMPNERIKERFAKLIDLSSGGGDDWTRLELYALSWKTFLNNPFGVGPYYFENFYGIGNHSQILDDLARYGIGAVAFYAVFFITYYNFLKDKWKRVNGEKVVLPYILVMIVFLMLNPGFRGNAESLITLFVMPGLPLVLEEKFIKKG